MKWFWLAGVVLILDQGSKWIADALLGAVALGDIGKFYPDTDMKWKDLDSMVILRDVAAKFADLQARIVNVDAVVYNKKTVIDFSDAAIFAMASVNSSALSVFS